MTKMVSQTKKVVSDFFFVRRRVCNNFRDLKINDIILHYCALLVAIMLLYRNKFASRKNSFCCLTSITRWRWCECVTLNKISSKKKTWETVQLMHTYICSERHRSILYNRCSQGGNQYQCRRWSVYWLCHISIAKRYIFYVRQSTTRHFSSKMTVYCFLLSSIIHESNIYLLKLLIFKNTLCIVIRSYIVTFTTVFVNEIIR
jgi:hypothetical protein